MPKPADLAQAQLDAYNAQDLETFCSYFADDVCVADLNGSVTVQGIAAYRTKYAQMFADFPTNKATLLGRIAVGNVVVDHERVARSADAAPFEVAAIYTCRADKIARVDFVKA